MILQSYVNIMKKIVKATMIYIFFLIS